MVFFQKYRLVLCLLALVTAFFSFSVPAVQAAGDGVCDCQVTVAAADDSCSGENVRSFPFGDSITRQTIIIDMSSAAGCSLIPTFVSDAIGADATKQVEVSAETCSQISATVPGSTHTVNLECTPAESGFTSGNSTGLIETCANKNLIPGEAGCRDANILLLQLIRIGEFLFSIIGILAFLMFIYGGFSLVLSMGNAEKAKKATATLAAAVVGLLIAFGSVLLIDFMLDALGVLDEFTL